MRPLLAILWKDVVLRWSDPTVLLLALGVPLAIATLVELAFGDLVLGQGIPDTGIPVAVVNQDRCGAWGNFGTVFEHALAPHPEAVVLRDDLHFSLFSVRPVTDETQALRLLEQEKLVAVLFIPPDFSEVVIEERAAVRVYTNDRYIFRGIAFQSAVETLANLIASGEVTVRTTVSGLSRSPHTRALLRSGLLNDALADLVRRAVLPDANPIQVQRAIPPAVLSKEGWGDDLAHYLAAAIAVFFSGYTALVASAWLLQEKEQGTWQRTLITPVPPGILLAGKALGIYLKVLIQLSVLFGSVLVMEWLLSGSPPSPLTKGDEGEMLEGWELALLIPAVAAAAAGIGMTIAGFAGTHIQAANYGRAVLLLMGLAGGSFFPVELFPEPVQALSRLTYHFWAMDGYSRLALGGSAVAIWPHVLVLTAMGLLFSAVGGWFLHRRIVVE